MINLKQFLIENQIVQEYPYMRNPEIVAKFLNNSFNNKKLIFYGDGKHTKEVITLLDNSVDIVAIIENVKKDQGFISESFNRPVIKMEKINNINFDYLILLGYWTTKNINNFILKHNIDKNKVADIYRFKQIQKKSSDTIEKYVKKRIKVSKSKPSLSLFIHWECRDFFTASSKILSKYFHLTKIYYTENITAKNTYFSNVITCKNNFYILKEIYKKYDFDITLFFNSYTFGIFFANFFIENIFNKNRKFVFSTTESSFSEIFDFSYSDYKEMLGLNEKEVDYGKTCYNNIIMRASGIVLPFGKPFSEKYILNKNKNFLFYYHSIPEENFVFKKIKIKNKIKFCHVGGVINETKKNRIGNAAFGLIETFETILNFVKNSEIHLWTNYAIKRNNNRIIINNYISHEKVPETLSYFHFGLILRKVNMSNEMEKMFYLHDKSHVRAKFLSYVSAGIPVIVHPAYDNICEIVRKHKIGIIIRNNDYSDLPELLKSYDYSQLKKNVENFQKYYKQQNYPEKLSKFLLELL